MRQFGVAILAAAFSAGFRPRPPWPGRCHHRGADRVHAADPREVAPPQSQPHSRQPLPRPGSVELGRAN